jgi:glucan phosphoethanolaminetransferase (alkaline phosphatase superfamily)
MSKDEAKDIDYLYQTNKLHTGKIKGDEAFNDTNAAKLAVSFMKKSGKIFILINKKGCHFHYARCYPENRKVFQPCMVWEEPVVSREKLINTYENGINWSVDEFFRILLDKTDLRSVTIFYTSDHGQNLLDDGKPATHCRYRTATPNEARVPLFVITGNTTAANRLRKSAEAELNHASGFQLNSTIINFMGYPLDYAENRSGTSLFNAYNSRRFFFAGNIRYGRPIEIMFK